jgi:membrane associated rhomboid family serine protease
VIPLSDNVPSRRRPWITYLIIALNAGIFLHQLSLPGGELAQLLATYAVIPARVGGPLMLLFPDRWPALVPLVTAAFLHGSWVHVGGNMLYMWIFGDNVEGSMGSLRFLLFYLLAGALGNLAHVVANPHSVVPTIGASGAVAGVLGAYLLMFPHARVLALVPLGLFFTVAEIPAVVFLLIWFLLQLLSGITAFGAQTVAWWAHIGGFLAGMILVLWFRRNSASRRRRSREIDIFDQDNGRRPW